MDGGTLFRVRAEVRTRVLTEMSEICLHKNEFGGYSYKNVNTLLTQIKRVLKRQLYEDSADRMKGTRERRQQHAQQIQVHDSHQ